MAWVYIFFTTKDLEPGDSLPVNFLLSSVGVYEDVEKSDSNKDGRHWRLELDEGKEMSEKQLDAFRYGKNRGMGGFTRVHQPDGIRKFNYL